jgi:fatty-acyl-CoA synthase
MDSTTVGAVLSASATKYPNNVAFIIDDVRETYAEVLERSILEARSMLGAGVRPGDRVGILMPNCIDFTHVLYGASLIGALVVPINARLAPRELHHVITQSGIKVLVTTDLISEFADYVDRLHRAFPELANAPLGETPTIGDLSTVVLLGNKGAKGMLSLEAWRALGAAVDASEVLRHADNVKADDSYIMMYTSGTTAMPKGCPLSHRAVIQSGRGLCKVYDIGPNDHMWNPLPLFHVSAQAPLSAVISAGGTWISNVHFEAKASFVAIVEENATMMWAAYPTLIEPLLSLPEYQPDSFKNVKMVLTCAPPDLIRSYQERLPFSTHVSCYGSTESGGAVIVGSPDDSLEVRLTCGRPLPGVEIQIRDIATGEEVAPGVQGALWIRGYNLFKGYWLNPEATAEVMDKEGWFNTGDLASVDAARAMMFLGRVKDMLKVGGENVASVELESFLCSHPAIAMAAVVGIPDPKYTEVPAAFLELRPNMEVSEEEILSYCQDGLAKFKVPRYLRFVTEWPMSLTKIRKFELRDNLIAELAAETNA